MDIDRDIRIEIRQIGAGPQSALAKLLLFLDRLEKAKIWYRLIHVRDSIMVELTVPGQRWEVEFFEDGHVEVERFISASPIEDERALETLFTEYAD